MSLNHPLSGALLAAALLPAFAGAQTNLVPNPGFETLTTCPTGPTQLSTAAGWSSPTTATPENCNACNTSNVSVPNNFWGSQAAHGGRGYAAVIAYGVNANWREYAEIQLSSPLTNGQTYNVSFWVSLADTSRWAVGDFGAHLQAGSHASGSSGPLLLTPQIANPSSNILSNTASWVQISGSFTAAGGETHIAIGNFKSNAATNAQELSTTGNWCAYYIDDVSVTAQPSQGGCDGLLIGWSDLAGASTGFVDVQDVENNCQPARTRCSTQTPVQAQAPYAGGTGYDPRYQTVWVSDGLTNAEYYTQASRVCRPRCAPFRAVRANSRALVSGLAVANTKPRLFQLATAPGYFEITTYDNSGRCPGRTVTCRDVLPQGAIAGGLAYDEVRDEIYYSVSIPQANGAWQTVVYIAPSATPCRPRCKSPVFDCSRSLVTGLAFNSCNQRIYATDGQVTQIAQLVDANRCQIRLLSCCKKQTRPIYRGLAIIPQWKKGKVGRACATRGCFGCPNIDITCTGDPSLGTNFQIGLRNAPANSTAYLFVQPGPCGPGISLPPPFFCGTFYPNLGTATAFGPVSVNGTSSCNGSANISLPIPVDPDLCCTSVCTQWFTVCRGFAGTALSPAMEFTIVGN